MKSYLLCFLLAPMSIFFSCQQKEKTTAIKTKKSAQAAKPIINDSIKKDIETIEITEEKEVISPDNKYFLISASFKVKENADLYSEKLIEKGYNSEVIERRTGKNQEFFKVSYQSFHDRTLAFEKLRMERKNPEKDSVWLLIK